MLLERFKISQKKWFSTYHDDVDVLAIRLNPGFCLKDLWFDRTGTKDCEDMETSNMCTRVPLLPASMIAIVRSGISLSLRNIFFFWVLKRETQKQKRPWHFCLKDLYDWTEQEEDAGRCYCAGIHDRSVSISEYFFGGWVVHRRLRREVLFSFVCVKKKVFARWILRLSSSLLSHHLFLFSLLLSSSSFILRTHKSNSSFW